MVLFGTVEIARPARSGRNRRIAREFLTRCRARQQSQQSRGILECRDQLFDAGHDDVDPRQGLRQVAVALIGHDDAGTGLGDKKVGARDPDVGSKKTRAQDRTRLVTHLPRLDQQPARVERTMLCAKGFGDLLLHQVDCRRNDVARRLMA